MVVLQGQGIQVVDSCTGRSMTPLHGEEEAEGLPDDPLELESPENQGDSDNTSLISLTRALTRRSLDSAAENV